jgi:hypothetical protein
MGGAHQQTFERPAPPVSVEEKMEGNWEKKKKNAIISAFEHTILKLTDLYCVILISSRKRP